MGASDKETISLLKLRHDLSNVVNNVIYKGKEYIVIKNQNPNLIFKITPLATSALGRKKTSEEIWESFVDRKKLKNISLEKIRQEEKNLRKY